MSLTDDGAAFAAKRARLKTYFDATALEAWARLTSDAPVSRIRETVRRGRDEMRQTLLGWLPRDLTGWRLLDAGCGAGQLSIEAARRGADVVGVDIAGNLVAVARERAAAELPPEAAARIEFRVGDMIDQRLVDPSLGRFDAAVAMDVLIHYRRDQILDALAQLGQQVEKRLLFTVAPRTPALWAMGAAGKMFPRSDRAPSIEPTAVTGLSRRLAAEPRLNRFRETAGRRISVGFYVSHAMMLEARS